MWNIISTNIGLLTDHIYVYIYIMSDCHMMTKIRPKSNDGCNKVNIVTSKLTLSISVIIHWEGLSLYEEFFYRNGTMHAPSKGSESMNTQDKQ